MSNLNTSLKTGDTFEDAKGTVTVVDRVNFNDTTTKTCRLSLKRNGSPKRWTVDL